MRRSIATCGRAFTRIDEDEAVSQSEVMMRRAAAAANRLDIHTDNKTNERCAVAAYEAEASRYAA